MAMFKMKYTILKLHNNTWKPLYRLLPQSHIEAESDSEAIAIWHDRTQYRTAQLLLVTLEPFRIVDDQNLFVSRINLAKQLFCVNPRLAHKLTTEKGFSKGNPERYLADRAYPQELQKHLFASTIHP
ncbi:hypothetical protein A6E01_19780 (plasmid) [Vibrio breoganii]|uniref:Uncharacterized protein n=2 Tax=Vibrio breoganii TaxID=553239 RepID=A0AAN0XZE9_9VIBR|nr:hypothetical protein A6E01_19780 [Vibrio breoganii]